MLNINPCTSLQSLPDPKPAALHMAPPQPTTMQTRRTLDSLCHLIGCIIWCICYIYFSAYLRGTRSRFFFFCFSLKRVKSFFFLLLQRGTQRCCRGREWSRRRRSGTRTLPVRRFRCVLEAGAAACVYRHTKRAVSQHFADENCLPICVHSNIVLLA